MTSFGNGRAGRIAGSEGLLETGRSKGATRGGLDAKSMKGQANVKHTQFRAPPWCKVVSPQEAVPGREPQQGGSAR